MKRFLTLYTHWQPISSPKFHQFGIRILLRSLSLNNKTQTCQWKARFTSRNRAEIVELDRDPNRALTRTLLISNKEISWNGNAECFNSAADICCVCFPRFHSHWDDQGSWLKITKYTNISNFWKGRSLHTTSKFGACWKIENQRAKNSAKKSSGKNRYVRAYGCGCIRVHVSIGYHTCARRACLYTCARIITAAVLYVLMFERISWSTHDSPILGELDSNH